MGFRVLHVAESWQLIATVVLWSALGWAANAADSAVWATGATVQQRLAQPINILWSGAPLRQAVAALSQTQEVAILIDRRIDPDQKLDLALKGVPMEEALQEIAAHCGLGASRLGNVVYLGPTSAAERLGPIAAELKKQVLQLPKAAQRKFFLAKSLAWNDLSTPRNLLAQLAERNGLEIAGLERVPHDLWAAADLPPLSLVDRLTLIAVQFDLAFTIAAEGTQIQLIPAPANLPAHADRSVAKSSRHSGPKRTKEPSTSVEKIRIKRMAVEGEPLGSALRQLSARLGLELKIDENAIQAAGVSLDQRVSVKVENATIDELFGQLLKSTGLTFSRRQTVVEIMPSR